MAPEPYRSVEESSVSATVARPPSDEAEPPGWEISDWDLSELLPDATEPTVAQRLEEIESLVQELESAREELKVDMEPARFHELLGRFEFLLERLDLVAGYASLWFSSDTQSSTAVAFRNRIRQTLTQLHNRVLFFTLWWKGLEDADAERLLPADGGDTKQGDYRHFLLEMRRFKPFTLDETSEQLINLKDANGIDAVVTLYSMLTNKMEFELEIDGEKKTLSEEEMRAQFFAPDPDLRIATYRELFRVYEDESKILAQIYANRVRDWHTENVELRGFASPIAVRNLSNDVSDEAVQTMLDVVYRNAPLFQDYFRMKGEWLGLPRVRRYDLYAPLAESDRQVPYGEAVDSVLSTFRTFDDEFADLAERVFRDRHIDSAIRKGKRSGAFCATILPSLTPYVLVNYTGRVRDVATLAHELGHAVHSLLARRHSVLTQHPPLPLAETASVFSEMLMTDRMLSREQDPIARRELLASAVDDIYATVMRQTFFVRFEVAAHEAVLQNRSADDLLELYEANLADQFGPHMDIGPEFRYEWLSIPHLFNTPFYCYAYSFGQLLVLSLYRRYQEQGDAFKPGYLRLLSYGGANSPAEALAEIDIDITSAEFWQGGFEVVRGMIDELRELDF
ncbi:MAG: M3 family oligoendopeptidase [Thermoanaerobaculia bacterium]|nr:M3 family oligoendopeptidase [Thermoanaerobaculia bacterium]